MDRASIHVVSHIDADGLASGSIAYEALDRAGKDVDIEFIRQLERKELERIKEADHELVWFTDLGTGQLNSLGEIDCVITDHHEPQKKEDPVTRDRENILSYCQDSYLELNPHRYGIDGASELSGSGATYLVAQELGDNTDLSKIAIVGAVGDLQARKEGKLIGKNREILEEGISNGHIEKRIDTRFYGIESRPLNKVLEYASEPVLPGLTGDEEACTNFLIDLDIPLKEEDQWRRWYDLEKEEKRRIMSTLAKRILNCGFPPHYVDELVGEVYHFPGEKIGSMLHEAKEFSTLLNSCGRYGEGKVGMEICTGDRDDYFKKAKDLLKGHQKVLVDSMKYVESIGGVNEREHLQYFHGRDSIPDTVLGTVAGMILGSGDTDRSMPMIAFTESDEDDGLKVSSRGTERLVNNGLDLSIIMSQCSDELGGEGGGHDIAAGAFIPAGKEEDFLRLAEDMVREQLGRGKNR